MHTCTVHVCMHRYVRNGTSVPHAVLMIENCPDTGFSIPLIMYTKFVLTKFGLTSKILKLAGKCLMIVATIISTIMQCVRYVTRGSYTCFQFCKFDDS